MNFEELKKLAMLVNEQAKLLENDKDRLAIVNQATDGICMHCGDTAYFCRCTDQTYDKL